MNVDNNINKEEINSEMCKTCKQFWANAAFQGLCSKCYNDSKKDKKVQKVEQTHLDKKEGKKQEEEVDKKMSKGEQTNKSRCFECRKKIGLLGIQCKCGYIYCNAHRLPQDHQCDFDYESLGKKQLMKENVKVAHEKLTEM